MADDVIRLLFWNAFLLSPHPIPGGPGLPAVGELAAPAVAERATAIGATLRDRFDVVAFAEAFEPDDQQRILDAWGAADLETAVGPGRSILRGPLGFASSGLFTVVAGRRIVRRATHRFATRGSYRYDADALANKGVLLVEVELAGTGANLEIYSTHLCWGTGLLGGRTARDPRRRHRIRMAQIGEVVDFVRATHRPGNATVLVGDLNIAADDPAYPDGPDAQYADLTARLGVLGLRDVWVDHGTGAGHTCGAPTDAFADQVDPDDADALGDVVDPDRTGVDPAHLAERVRIDYVFTTVPAETGPFARVDSVRRYAFPRRPGAPGRDRLVRLSDHLAVGVDLVVEPG